MSTATTPATLERRRAVDARRSARAPRRRGPGARATGPGPGRRRRSASSRGPCPPRRCVAVRPRSPCSSSSPWTTKYERASPASSVRQAWPAGRRPRLDGASTVRPPCATSSATSPWAEAPSLRSRTTRSSRTARSARSSRRAATSSGCACRAWTARRSSARCSTATPGRFRLAPGRHRGARRPPLPAGHDGPRDDVGHADGLGHRPRRAARSVPWHHDDERSNTHRRSPTDNDADHVLLRTMRCVNGRVEMHMECEPRVDYGRKRVTLGVRAARLRQGGRRAPRTTTSSCTLTTDLRIGFEGGRARARTHPARRRHRVRRAVVERARRPRDLRRRLPPARASPPTSGTSGSATASSPTIRGAPTCSAAR